MRKCWCGSTSFKPFGDEYGECTVCESLVYLKDMPPEQLLVRDDDTDFYGKNYWLQRQGEEFGTASIFGRARNDLTERNLHWLNVLHKYRLPPATVLELGCSHGSFVALLRHAGYDASGVEMSPWVVDYGKRTFDVPVALGPLETLDLTPGSIDVIVLMDVLEHLSDPVTTMTSCLAALKPDGIMLLQTPQFKVGMNHAHLVKTQARFLEMLIPEEHIYLFSEESVSRLFKQLGAQYVQFEPAIFAHYDMFFVVSRVPLQTNSEAQIDEALEATPRGRLVRALLDLRKRELTISEQLAEAEADRSDRGKQINILSTLLKGAEADRAARGAQIDTLTQALRESENDRAARGQQINTLHELLSVAETDRAARGAQIATLTQALSESENDRTARAQQIDTLHELLSVAEADRGARGQQIETLNELLRSSEADRVAQAQHNKNLADMVNALEMDRASDRAELETLNAQVRELYEDREALKREVKDLTANLTEVQTMHREQHARLTSIITNVNSLFARRRLLPLTKLTRLPEVHALTAAVRATTVVPRMVAVDLTPILPGGENGGAKIFVLELLRRLGAMAPKTQFVLLTQAASHEELGALDRANMRRIMVIGTQPTDELRSHLKGLASRILAHLPGRASRVLGRVGARVNQTLKRSGSSTMLREMGVDLLFCPFTAPTHYEPGIPTVCTIYDLQYKTYPEFFSPEDVAHRDHTFMMACRYATVLAAISNYSRDSAAAHGRIEPARLRTIYLRMAQRTGSKSRQSKAVLTRLGLAAKRYLIYPANFWKHKNHEMLLTAFGMACRGGGLAPDVKLVCTGSPGVRQTWLIQAAESMGLGDRVLFPGFLPDNELSSLIANCGGVVFPSLYEGFGLPVIEAMAAGVPVACSNITSLPEVAADAAILFDPRVPDQIARAIVSLMNDEALRARLVQAGEQRAVEFSDGDRMAREYWEYFQYALVNARHENLLTGVHTDGWAGPTLNIQTAPITGGATLEIEITSPDWHPAKAVEVQAYSVGKPVGEALLVARGATATLKLEMTAAANYYELRFGPTFVPAHSGMGDDQRELSVLLRRCSILKDNSSPVELFPERATA